MDLSFSNLNHAMPVLIGGPAPAAFLDEPQYARCGHAIIDALLAESGTTDPSLADQLLDLKFALLQRRDAEETLAHFYRVRSPLEQGHYLASYRLRRWLERQMKVSVSPGRDYPARSYPLRLTPSSIDALFASIRRVARNEVQRFPGGFPVVRFHFLNRPECVTASPDIVKNSG
jgi:hypothetical protein